MNEVNITIHTQQVNERCASVTLAGRLDAGNAQMIKETLMQLINGGAIHLVVDLAQVPFIAAQLAALVSASRPPVASGAAYCSRGYNPRRAPSSR
jgi:anti-anti-sigma factor